MRFILQMSVLVLSVCIISCKDDWEDTRGNSSPDFLDQSIVYKTYATIPSPADSAKGLLRDSLSVFRKILKSDMEFLKNIPNLSAGITQDHGFSFGYGEQGNSRVYFMFTAYAFPTVTRYFKLDNPYEHTSMPGGIIQYPLFLGTHTGYDGMTYFINNEYPPDAGSPLNKTYTNVTFTKLIKITLPPEGHDTAYFASGHIHGYQINYYHNTDTTKYPHRWDFTVDFTDLRIEM